MSYNYNATPVYEMPNQKNKENVEYAMSVYVPEEKATMSSAYAAAENEYKDGHIKEGDALREEGRKAANQAAGKYAQKGDEVKSDREKEYYFRKAQEVQDEASKREENLAKSREDAEKRHSSISESVGGKTH